METKVTTYICYYFHSNAQQESTYHKDKTRKNKTEGGIKNRPNGIRLHKGVRKGYKPPTRKSYICRGQPVTLNVSPTQRGSIFMIHNVGEFKNKTFPQHSWDHL